MTLPALIDYWALDAVWMPSLDQLRAVAGLVYW